MMAKAIMYKKKSENATAVLIGLYSKGFYVKGVLNHISGDLKKSRKNQFVCAGLLRNVFKLQFKNEFVLWIFHETVELKMEAMLFLFPNKSIQGCHHFFEYLKLLISDRFCDADILESFCGEYECQSTTSTKRSDRSKLKSHKLIANSNVPKAKVPIQSKVPNDNSDNSSVEDEVFHVSRRNTMEKPLHFTGYFRNSNGDAEEFEDSSDTETNQSSNSHDSMKDTPKKRNKDQADKAGNSNYAFWDSGDEFNMISDTETEQSMDSSFWKSNPNEYNQILEQLEGIEDTQVWDMSNFSYFNYFDKEMEKSQINIFDETNIFCWPEYLVSTKTFTSSLLVEMTFIANNMANNWGLLDKIISTGSVQAKRVLPEFVWDERIDRIHYDPIKKKFQVDDDGCLLIYCCRQTSLDEEVEGYY